MKNVKLQSKTQKSPILKSFLTAEFAENAEIVNIKFYLLFLCGLCVLRV